MNQASPSVSVVVPTRNRAARLRGLVAALEQQTLPAEKFELVVVDDGSTDDTATVLKSVSVTQFAVTALTGSGAGPAAARNAGWQRARAPIIAFTDDDCEPTPAWLELGLAAARANAGAFVQGPTSPLPRERSRLGPFSRTKSIAALGPWYQTCNIFYPRELLVRLGGFDERFTRPFGEDADLAWRALDAGARAVFATPALVHHAVEDLGVRDYLRTALRDPDEARLFKLHPGLRSQVAHWRIFKSKSHAYLALALAGVALAGQRPAAIVLTTPYARFLIARSRAPGARLTDIPLFIAYDALEGYAATHGALRHRVFAL